MSSKKGIMSALISVSGVVALGKIMGFVKQMITANAFGATIRTDIISLSQGIVSDMDYVVVQALITAFVPTYINLKNKKTNNEKQFVLSTIIVFFVLSTIVSVVLFLLSGFLAKIIAPSYEPAESEELAKYIRIVAPLFVLIIQLAILNALLKANEVFLPGELIGFNQSIILIVLILSIGSVIGPDTLVVGLYISNVINLIFLCCFSRDLWSIKRIKPFYDQNVKKLLLMMGPLLLGYSMVFVNQQVDKIIVSGLGEGIVTAMSYAAVLSNFIGTFIGSMSGVLFTYVTQEIVESNDDKASELISHSSVQLITLFLPISILTVINAKDIVTIVFGRGQFDSLAISNCSFALIGYGFMFVPYVIRELYSRFQYGYGDSKQPMINSSIAIGCNIILSIILSRIIGVLGVTIATSISVLLCAILNLFSSRKKNRFLKVGEYLKYLPRWFCGGVICAMVSIAGKMFFDELQPIIRIAFIVIISSIGYFIATYSIVVPLIRKLVKR